MMQVGVEAVADATGEGPMALPPLQATIDVDAMNALLDGDGGVGLGLRYADCIVDGDGEDRSPSAPESPPGTGRTRDRSDPAPYGGRSRRRCSTMHSRTDSTNSFGLYATHSRFAS